MKFRKTRNDNRSTYTFRFDNGTSVTLRPGEDGVTETDIRVLHSLDDAEVYSNIKNSRPSLTEAEKAAKKEWEAAGQMGLLVLYRQKAQRSYLR